MIKLLPYLLGTVLYIAVIIKQIIIVRQIRPGDKQRFTKWSFLIFSLCAVALAWASYFSWGGIPPGLFYVVISAIAFHVYIIKK